jgi:undecaprenyl-diphosphatase
MTIFEAIVLGIVEGLTEFLPISSTGHMVITSSLLGIEKQQFTKLFEIAIQLGAILAVVVLYWRKFLEFSRWQFYVKLLVGVMPALICGALFNDFIDKLLESPLTVAISTFVGGIILLFIDKAFRNQTIESDDQISYGRSFIIGCWQVIAMIPGVSRSAASIIGGMQQKLTRNLAAEFSFFLAVPTMFAATAFKLFLKNWGTKESPIKGYQIIAESSENIKAFAVGNIVAFVVALLAIRFFITFLKIYGFRVFGIYRILVGGLLIALYAYGTFA